MPRRKLLPWLMKGLRRRLKLELYHISLVNISDRLVLSLICEMEILPSLTHSFTASLRYSMCQLPFMVKLWHHFTYALLLLYTGDGEPASVMG
jgi:hypothetical protein